MSAPVDISWDPKKAKSNLQKHHVSFAEAATVFSDPLATNKPDRDHDDRMILTGYSSDEKLLIVVHVEILEEYWVRIISARKATRQERLHHQKKLREVNQ